MGNRIIYSSSLKSYESLLWLRQPAFSQYAKIKKYLTPKLDASAFAALAEPHVSSQGGKKQAKASWSSDQLDLDAQVFTALAPDDQIELKAKILAALKPLADLVKQLLASTDREEKKWGKLLEMALVIPDLTHLYTDNTNFVIVGWGFRHSSDEKGYSLLYDFPDYEKPEAAANAIATENTTPQEPIVKEEVAEAPTTEEQEEEAEEETAVTADQEGETSPDPTPDEPTYHTSATDEESEPAVSEEKAAEKTEKKKETKEEKNKEDEKKKPNYLKYWWVLLIIALLLALIWFLSQKSPKQVLPDEPNKIVPIDSTKITLDPDSIRSIVSDRLNVALTGSNRDLKAFATAFKEIYPADDYEVIYFDEKTSRLQLQVPQSELPKIKKELPKKLPDFKMLIWHESVFQSRRLIPTDPGFSSSEQKFWHHDKIQAFEAWDISQGDTGVVVAVIDDSFDLSHPEFRGKIFKPWNVVSGNSDVNTRNGGRHGTHVAGIAIGASDNGSGVAGIAPKCRFMPVQVGDANGLMSNTAIIDAVLYAINNGADVINMSLGMQFSNLLANLPLEEQKAIAQSVFKEEEAFWKDIFKLAYDENVVVVIAAGNQDLLLEMAPMQRSEYTINISAVDPNSAKASFSNYGDKSTLSAPGVQIYSSIPGNQFEYLDGTSMAAPAVAGGVALVKSVNPAISFNDIVDLFQSTGIPVGTTAEPIGNLIQLAKALKVVKNQRENMPIVDCPEVQVQIDSLLRVIKKLRDQCDQDGSTGEDSLLRIPDDGSKDLDFAVGRWKSTTYIYSVATGEKVTLYFDFYANGTGQITAVEPDNNQCVAALAIDLNNGVFSIDQLANAICQVDGSTYSPYKFECVSDANGYAQCSAQNKTNAQNAFNFQLVKIR